MKKEIKASLASYNQAFYNQDYTKAIKYLHKESIQDYRDKMVQFADQMDVFGETEEFLSRLKVKDLKALHALSANAFIKMLFAIINREIPTADLKKMIKGIKIVEIDASDDMANVVYEMPVRSFNSWTSMKAEVQLKQVKNEWKLLFKSGLDIMFSSFQKEIDLFYERAAKDQIKNLNHHENDLEVYTLMGYKNMEGDVVFEARYKDAGEFSEGLAYVKIMNKHGFINKKGAITLKPRYRKAQSFSSGLAAVRNEHNLWGFINKKAEVVIDYQFADVDYFNEGLCAVAFGANWGYINKKGKWVIEALYNTASTFYSGEAEVGLINEEGELEEFTIDKKGKKISY